MNRHLATLLAALAIGIGPAFPQQPTAGGPATTPAQGAPAAPTRVDPSLEEGTPTALEEPCHIEAVLPDDFVGKSHFYRLRCSSPGVHEMIVRFMPTDPSSEGFITVWTPDRFDQGSVGYSARPGEFRFYPVWRDEEIGFSVTSNRTAAGDRYAISFAPDACEVSEGLKAATRTTLDRGAAWLLSQKPADLEYSRQHAIEGLVLMALLGRNDPEARLDEDYIAWLAADRRDPEPPGAWRGQPVSYFGSSDGLYDQAIIAMAAAEAVSLGLERARPLAVAAQRYILAAQLTSRRCESWGPVRLDDPSYGGWRYTGNAEDADISVTGWCMIALLAGDAAGVTDPGVRESLDDATRFVRRCFKRGGFSYTVGSESGDVRNAIGAIALLLMGEEGSDLRYAEEVLDHHLPAGTQTVAGEDFPVYYAYYATRANYLRGGRAWERWRSVAMRQFTRLQREDGSWPAFGREEGISDRYNAAMAMMTLRICLEDVPAYLEHEAKGF